MQAPEPPKDDLNRPTHQKGSFEAKKVCLFGASVRAAAESAKNAGYEVYAIDRFGDRDTLRVVQQHLSLPDFDQITEREFEEFRRSAIQWTQSMPFLIVGGVRAADRLIRSLKPTLTSQTQLLIESAAKLRAIDVLQEACRNTLFRLPETRFLTAQEIQQSHGKSISVSPVDRYLIKSNGDSGGLGVQWFGGDGSGGQPCSSDAVVLQRWVPGRLFGSVFLSNGTEVGLLGTCRGRFTRYPNLPFVYCGSVGPVAIEPAIQDALLEVSARLVQQTGFRGIFNIDWLGCRQGPPSLIEVNPRWTASVELVERHWRERLTLNPLEMPCFSVLDWTMQAIEGHPLPRYLEKRTLDLPLSHRSSGLIVTGGAESTAFNSMGTPSSRNVSDPNLTIDNPEGLSCFVKRIIFSRRDQLFCPDHLSFDLVSGESLHDIPFDATPIRKGEPVCTLITRIPANSQCLSGRRYRSLIRGLSMGDFSQ